MRVFLYEAIFSIILFKIAYCLAITKFVSDKKASINF